MGTNRFHPRLKESITIAGVEISPGEQVRIEMPLAQLATQGVLNMPLEILSGTESGPCLLICAAVHGDEIIGIEIIRQLLPLLSTDVLRGTLIMVPILNVPAFLQQSRYLPDRRDLNRSFPGSRGGSQASRIAHTVMESVVQHCSHVIDIHSASLHRRNVPQIRANLNNAETRDFAMAFGAPVVVHAAERDGSLRMASGALGTPTIVFEGGEACRFDPEAIEIGLQGIINVIHALDMMSPRDIHIRKLKRNRLEGPEVYQKSRWVRATRGGLFRAHIQCGQFVQKDQFLGFVADAFGEGMSTLRSPKSGMIIGLTCNPVVHHGDALVHIAYEKDNL